MKKSLLALAMLSSFGAVVACYSDTSEPSASPTGATLPSDPPPEDGEPPPAKEDEDKTPTPKPAEPKPGTPDAGTDAAPPVTGPQAFTEAELQSLVTQRCGGCHDAAPMNLKASFATATIGVKSSQVPALSLIQKGDKSKSYLFHKVSGTQASVGGMGARMPKGGPALSATELERLGKYIDGL